MEPEVKYGLQVSEGDEGGYWSTVYKITTDDTGVWVDRIGTFEDKETAHAFVRAWNGEETPA